MRKTFILISALMLNVCAMAQGSVAPDWTQTDINGTEHNLYTYLEQGKVVILDMSATWCGPCWSFHQAHYLQSLHDQFGPNGTNEAVVIFYEDDVQTTLADLQGTGSNTYGNWVQGVTYPIINATQGLPSVYGAGYPTISVICHADKKIKDNLFNYQNIDQMKTAVQNVIDNCNTLADIDETTADDQSTLQAYPNPSTGITTVGIYAQTEEDVKIQITDISGKVVFNESQRLNVGRNNITLNLEQLEKGMYVVQTKTTSGIIGKVSIVKE